MKNTPFTEKHIALGAKMHEFAGYNMPIEYPTGIIQEHMTVVNGVGVFDVSHMGEFWVKGPNALAFLQQVTSNNVAALTLGQAQYTCFPNEQGGIVDDLIVYYYEPEKYLLVVNAANIDKDWAWMCDQAKGFDIDLKNMSDYYGQLAVQGPEAEQVVEEVLGLQCKEMTFYTAKTYGAVGEVPFIISRTGYTGEDGFEIYATPDVINEYWDKLMACGRCKPCGLGCRDTLRFEVGLPLYGDELSDDITPVMAGLSMFCKFEKDEFIGKEALQQQKADGPKQRVIGIELKDKAIPRHGYDVLFNGEKVGEVTTGYHSISSDKSVCMALVDAAHAKLGTELSIQIRKKTFPGVVVKKRFYDKHYKK